MARIPSGRHRAPGFNPLNELGDIAARSAQPALKASAVVVASGGLVAAFAIPASASPTSDRNTHVALAASVVVVPEGLLAAYIGQLSTAGAGDLVFAVSSADEVPDVIGRIDAFL